MGCLFSSYYKNKMFGNTSVDDYASFIDSGTMELLIKNDESIFIDNNQEINQKNRKITKKYPADAFVW